MKPTDAYRLAEHIDAYTLAELNAGLREFTDRVYRWHRFSSYNDDNWTYFTTNADTPGDTAVEIVSYRGSTQKHVVVTTAFVAGRELGRETPPHVLQEAMENYHDAKTSLEIGRLVGVNDRLILDHWHPDKWQRCNGVHTSGVRIVQKHLVPPGHSAMTTGSKCRLCLRAYRYIRRQICSLGAGETLTTMFDDMLPRQLSQAHGVAYQYPIKPYSVYRAG